MEEKDSSGSSIVRLLIASNEPSKLCMAAYTCVCGYMHTHTKQFSDVIFACDKAKGIYFAALKNGSVVMGSWWLCMMSATVLREWATFIEWPLRLVLSGAGPGSVLPDDQSPLIWSEAPGKTESSFPPCVAATGPGL